ncbi:hypothetical protein [Brachybacterium sp. Marseille-Q7125]|uniref:hypothetical protein n=1 Tax=Brachybacterium sp. Marseille-Q7125 TaxID=2932815 RepID=UPI001FF67D69
MSAPASAWLRPLLVLLGGAVFCGLLMLVRQEIVALPVALLTLLMVYWTSPLRRGDHTSLAAARERASAVRSGATPPTVVLWAPGNPASARLHTAIRGPREDVIWVNVYRDRMAMDLLVEQGGAEALPLALHGDAVHAAVTPGELLELLAQD